MPDLDINSNLLKPMKAEFYFFPFAACMAMLTLLGQSHGGDAELLEIIKKGQPSSTVWKIFETGPESSNSTGEQGRTLKPVSAFGSSFAARLTFKGTVQDKLAMWTDDPSMAPQAGLQLFEKMVTAFNRALGQGKVIAHIPNHGDASEVKSTAVLWFMGPDIVLLQLDQYPSRAGIKVVRSSRESWRGGMGADESEFWERTLGLKGGF
jgi:hypothetical protein